VSPVNWDDLSLIILAAFGCLTLLLTQIGEVLSKLPQIIRAWRQVRIELRNDTNLDSQVSERRTQDHRHLSGPRQGPPQPRSRRTRRAEDRS